MASLRPGGLLARRYRLIDQIGAGGMSVIWRARDEVLDRVVAIKVLAASLAADDKFREMVRDEARAAAQLVHPHVTAVHDYGETLAPDGSLTAFVVMELLTGEELKARLTAGPLPWAAAVEVCAQVAEALAAAHRLGIVHRDITPANIMMTGIGAKVLDFGIATHVGAPDEDEDGETFGTPAYVAPERLDGTPARPATDTYSLGVLLYETLTGRVPFPAETWDELTRALEDGRAPTLPEVPGLPPGVADVCLRCLTRDPADRPTTAQVAETLRGHLVPDPRTTAISAPVGTPAAAASATDPGPAQAGPAQNGPAQAGGGQDGPAQNGPAQNVGGQNGPAQNGPAQNGPAQNVGGQNGGGQDGPAPSGAAQNDPAPGAPVRPWPADPAPAPGGSPQDGTPGHLTPAAGTPAGPGHRPRVPALVLVTAAVVVLTAAVLLGSALRDGPEPQGRRPTAGPELVSPPVAPSAGGAVPETPSGSPYLPPGSGGPTAGVAPTIGEAVARLDRLVEAGVTSRVIRDDAGVDLRNHLRNLRASLAARPVDLAGPVAQLREKVAVRANEGSITREYAEQLDGALVQLAAAV